MSYTSCRIIFSYQCTIKGIFPFYIYLDLIYLYVRFFNVFFKEINSSIFCFIFLFICVILAIYHKQMFEMEVLTTAKLNKIKQDTILKNFWKNNDRFADLFNTFLFNGKEILKPDDLTEVDTDVSSMLKFNGHAETVQKILDVVKKKETLLLRMNFYQNSEKQIVCMEW